MPSLGQSLGPSETWGPSQTLRMCRQYLPFRARPDLRYSYGKSLSPSETWGPSETLTMLTIPALPRPTLEEIFDLAFNIQDRPWSAPLAMGMDHILDVLFWQLSCGKFGNLDVVATFLWPDRMFLATFSWQFWGPFRARPDVRYSSGNFLMEKWRALPRPRRHEILFRHILGPFEA